MSSVQVFSFQCTNNHWVWIKLSCSTDWEGISDINFHMSLRMLMTLWWTFDWDQRYFVLLMLPSQPTLIGWLIEELKKIEDEWKHSSEERKLIWDFSAFLRCVLQVELRVLCDCSFMGHWLSCLCSHAGTSHIMDLVYIRIPTHAGIHSIPSR